MAAAQTFMTDEPRTIFDSRQKALIVVLVSTAATCKLLRTIGSLDVDALGQSLWFRVQHLLFCHPEHCSRSLHLGRTD